MTPTTAFPQSLARPLSRWVDAWIGLWALIVAALWLSAALLPSALPTLGAQPQGSAVYVAALPGHAASARRAAAIRSPLAWQLRDSDDLMNFIEAARFDPASGGFYYALKAYDFCVREAKVADPIPHLEDLLPDDPVPDLHRQNAARRIATLCRGFVPSHALPFSYISLIEEGQARGDPRLALSQRLEKLSASSAPSAEFSDPVARAALLDAVLATRDPWLLRDLAAELRLIDAKVTLAIDGEAIAPEEHRAFLAALDRAACGFGAPCRANDDWYQLLACSQGGKCDATEPAQSTDPLRATPQEQRIYRWQQRIRYRLLNGPNGWLDFVPRRVPAL